jgi:hypothetical protein
MYDQRIADLEAENAKLRATVKATIKTQMLCDKCGARVRLKKDGRVAKHRLPRPTRFLGCYCFGGGSGR